MEGVQFGFGLAGPGPVSDAELLTGLVWKSTAPRALRQAAATGQVETFLPELRSLVAEFPKLSAARKELRRQQLAWSLPTDDHGTELRNLFETALADIPPALAPLAITSRELLPQLGQAIVALETLAQHGTRLTPENLWWCWSTALNVALEAYQNIADWEEAEAIALGGELLFRCEPAFSLLKNAPKARQRGAETLSEDLLDETDVDGTPRGSLLPELSRWLAPLVRTWEIAGHEKASFWSPDARERIGDLLTVLAGFCDASGNLGLCHDPQRQLLTMLLAGCKLAGWQKAVHPRGCLESILSHTPARQRDLPYTMPVIQSDWAKLGCLRNNWGLGADMLLVAHDDPLPLLDLAAFGRLVFSGTWGLEVKLDGKELTLADSWESVCWHTDEDGDYLELQMKLPQEIRLERQLFLSRTDHFAILADNVCAGPQQAVEYRSLLPLAAEVRAVPDRLTREIALTADVPLARVFPLGLEQDRVRSVAGELSLQDRNLCLERQGQGGVHVPLVLDWEPSRQQEPAQWRALTVTEERRILPHHIAAGHRLRLGELQLLIFHQLHRGSGPRAVLGHQTFNETVIGQFDSSGDVTPLLLVE